MYSIVIRTAGRGSVAQVNVEVEQSDNVAVLKQLIELMHPDAPKPSRQRLIYGGSVLNDHQVFSEIFAMAPGGGPHTIHLVVSEAATTTTSSTESSARPEPSSQQGNQYTSYQSPQGSQFPLGSHGNFMPRVNPQAIPVADNITADAYQHYVNYMAYWSSMGVVPGYTFPQFVEHVLPAIMAQMQTNIPARPMAPLDPNARADPGVEAAPRPAEQNRNPAGNDFDNFTQLLMKGFVIYMLMSQYGETKRWALLGFLVLIWYLNKLGYISLNYEFRRYYGMRDRQEAAEQQNDANVPAAGENGEDEGAEREREPQPVQAEPLAPPRISIIQELEALLFPFFLSLYPGWEEMQEQPTARQHQAREQNPEMGPNVAPRM